MRINCAHDDAEVWTKIISNLQRAKQELGRECRVEMDLAGPKLRTGPIDPTTQFVKWRPQRGLDGVVTTPARIWLTPLETSETPPLDVSGCLTIPAVALTKMHEGDSIKFTDLRGKSRVLEIGRATGRSRTAMAKKTAYLRAGSSLSFTHISRTAGLTSYSARRKSRSAHAPFYSSET